MESPDALSHPTRKTILVVDDDADWTDVLNTYFFDRYRVVTANLPSEAIEMARRESPAMVIVDLVMPSMDGFGLIRRLKDASSAPHVTVLVTGWKTPEVAKCAADMGCEAVLGKPIPLAALDEVVTALLEGDARQAATDLPVEAVVR